jgi:hypothetical protein
MNYITKLSPNKHLIYYGGEFMGVRFYIKYKSNIVEIRQGYENQATDAWYDSLYDWLEEYGFKIVEETA